MKNIFIILLISNILLQAQSPFYNLRQDEGLFSGGFGLTWIDGEPHYSFQLQPEITFSNFGLGLDFNLQFGSDGKVRTENFNEFSDYASIIRYVRYGQKRDPVYVRLGALDYATLGHGSIMYMYNNSPSFDTRKIGLEFDIDFTDFGFETVYGNFGQAGLAGLRGYVRPLKFTEYGSIPIIGNLEFGASVVSDFDKYATVTSGEIDSLTGKFKVIKDDGSMTALGFDIGLPVVRASFFKLDLYFDYVKLVNYGNGTALGMIMNFSGLGLVDVQTKFERRFNGDNYLPAYFNSFYEIERFKFNQNSGAVASKVQILKNSGDGLGNGFYGELLVKVLKTFDIIGSYQRLDKHPRSGILHLSSLISPEGIPYVLRAGYDKINIRDEKDLFTLDDRSYLYVEFGYKPMPFMIVSLVYNWTYTPIRDSKDNVVGYKPQKKIEPRISFVYPFNF